MPHKEEDIEMYFLCDNLQVVLKWIESCCGPLREAQEAGEITFYKISQGSVAITSTKASIPCISVWFISQNTRWDRGIDCARQAASDTGLVVRCDPGNEYPEVHPLSDVFLEIRDGRETLIEWET